jgi:hypothetical protein
MRIAQVAPSVETVPSDGYSGIDCIISDRGIGPLRPRDHSFCKRWVGNKRNPRWNMSSRSSRIRIIAERLLKQEA